VNEKKDAKSNQLTDQLPDRISTDPKSPYYNEAVLSRDVGIRFKGIEKTTRSPTRANSPLIRPTSRSTLTRSVW